MKTFEQYIGQASLDEARQNYIFGGTDNRNTEIKGKTFGELIPGDSFYWVSSFSDYPRRHKFESIKVKGSDTIIHYNDDGDEGACKISGNILDETCFVFKQSYGVWVTATDEKEFIKTVNNIDELKKITSADIK